MANIINLNKKRKEKKRNEKKKKAAENRIKFGRTKKEKQLIKETINRENRKLDGHKLEKTAKKDDTSAHLNIESTKSSDEDEV